MSASLPPGKPNPSGRNAILGLAVIGVVFLAGLVGVSVRMMMSLVTPKHEIMVIPTTVALQQAPSAPAPPQVRPPAGQPRFSGAAQARPRFAGKVVDAKTHEPVTAIIATIGYSATADQQITYLNTAPPGQDVVPTDGQYQLVAPMAPRPNSQWYVRVQADGYLPAVSAAPNGSATVDFELTPAKDITGIVYGADGKPAANVEVAVSLPGGATFIYIRGGKLTSRGGLQVRSGADGSYSVWPEAGDFAIAAASPENGVAVVSGGEIAKSADIHLSAWSQVEGQVLSGNKPMAGALVNIANYPGSMDSNSSLERISVFQSLESDAGGHFTFDFVKPGLNQMERSVAQQFGPKGRQFTSVGMSQLVISLVEPGKTVHANIGGGGRLVVGKLVLPAIGADEQYTIDAWAAAVHTIPLIPQMPDEVKNGTVRARENWMGGFALTSEGIAYLAAHPSDMPTTLAYAAEIAEDGSFRIEDVHAGSYQVQVTLHLIGKPQHIGQASFTMPPITPELVDQPLEIPDIKVQ